MFKSSLSYLDDCQMVLSIILSLSILLQLSSSYLDDEASYLTQVWYTVTVHFLSFFLTVDIIQFWLLWYLYAGIFWLTL